MKTCLNPAANTPGQPDPIDIHVGRRVRLRRIRLGFSQEKPGKGLGLTFQQIQKYGRGANRIGASRLWRIARLLGCHTSWFYDGLDANGCADESLPEALATRQQLELGRHFANISSPHLQKATFNMVKAVAATH